MTTLFKKVVLIVFLVLAVFAVLLGYTKKNKPIATVGGVKIYAQDIALRQVVDEKCYRSQKSRVEILAECVGDALELAVLQNAYGIAPPDSALEKKAKWIDQNTKDPQTLSCIKSIYGSNRKAYLANVVRPTLVNPKLHSLFATDVTIHKQERDRVLSLMQKVKNNPALLPTLAGYGIFHTKREQDTTMKVKGYNIKFRKDPFVEKVLKKIKPGQLWGNIVEDDYSYKIIRLLRVEKENYVWDGVIVKKKQFDNWFRNYISNNISITINNSIFKKELINRYPNLWWTKLLN